MRLTNQFSIMDRKHDLAYGLASIWKRKLKNDRYELIENAIDKLGQLEDIEEELGIDLITLFKALKYGIYFYGQKEKEPKDVQLRMFYEEPMLVYNEDRTQEVEVYVAGYGKSWALIREELENENQNN